jgi:Outer membrane protein beta-barrel domain
MRTRWSRFALAALSILAVVALTSPPALAQQASPLSLNDVSFQNVTFADTTPVAQAGATQTQVQPQQHRHEGIGIGIKVGPLFSSFSGSGVNSGIFSTSTGLQFGLFIGGNRPGTVGVATEINVLQKKSKQTDGSVDTLTALQVPVFLRINAGSSSLSGASFYVLLGPAIDVNFKANNSIIGDIKNNVQDFDVDFVGAAGVEITRFIVEGRYIRGLRNFSKNFQSSDAIKTQAFALLFGVRFN